MSSEAIENLQDLIYPKEEKKIVDQTITRLTAPGDNYGSVMLRVDIIVETPDGKREEIKAVAKTVPPNDFIQEIFNTQVTFRNEIAFYKIIVPTLQEFQRENGVEELIDFSPKYLGGRQNLDGDDDRVDSDAVLLLENLEASGYVNMDRTEGFDLEASKLIITDLAHLHGVSLAFKLRHPELFESKIKQYLHTRRMKANDNGFQRVIEKMRATVESLDDCKPFLERAMKILRQRPEETPPREPFATISHNDVWVNNTMIKLERGKAVENKLVDFQVCDYGSPAKDVLFFLFSSVMSRVLERHYDDLVDLYYKTFVGILGGLKCDTRAFSFEAFEKELDLEARRQFGHAAFMLFPMFAPKEAVKDISEMRLEDFASVEATDLHKQKLAFIIKEFVKRNWI